MADSACHGEAKPGGRQQPRTRPAQGVKSDDRRADPKYGSHHMMRPLKIVAQPCHVIPANADPGCVVPDVRRQRRQQKDSLKETFST